MGPAVRAAPQTAPRRQQSPNSAMPSRLFDKPGLLRAGLEKTGTKVCVCVCLRVGKKAFFKSQIHKLYWTKSEKRWLSRRGELAMANWKAGLGNLAAKTN